MNPFKYNLSLRVFTKTVEPADICAQLGLEPSIMRKTGERRTAPNGVPLEGVNDCSFCLFRLSQLEDELLADMIERISSTLLPHQELFHRIGNTGGKVSFYIGWFSKGNTAEDFPSSLLKRLGALGIDLEFDIYGSDRPMGSA
ncbi:MAG: DUF4279 domain-containing protein [Cyanobacteria bacterium SZAS LIN-3]|nr:DUF4279 domain-containing protein [Cyanobacteria bacterium SZAS LIN-3]